MGHITHATGEVRQDEYGREIPDPNPVEVPLGMKRPETLAEQVQRLVRTSISAHAEMHGAESFEEADDFDIEEDFDPTTPYETQFDPVIGKDITPADFHDPEKRAYLREQYLLAERNAIRAEQTQDAINDAFQESKKKATQAGRPAAAPSSAASAEPLATGSKPVHTT